MNMVLCHKTATSAKWKDLRANPSTWFDKFLFFVLTVRYKVREEINKIIAAPIKSKQWMYTPSDIILYCILYSTLYIVQGFHVMQTHSVGTLGWKAQFLLKPVLIQ